MCLPFLEKSVQNFCTALCISSYLARFLLELKMFHINVVQNIKVHILCSINFFENLAVYEIMLKKVYSGVEHRWPYGACTLHAEYLKLQTPSEHVILTALSLQQLLHECALMLRYTYI